MLKDRVACNGMAPLKPNQCKKMLGRLENIFWVGGANAVNNRYMIY